MKFRVTIVAEYAVDDSDPELLERAYGTTDPVEMAKFDQQHQPEELLALCDTVVECSVEPAPENA